MAMIEIPCPPTLREKGFALQHERAADQNYLRAYFIAENLPLVSALPWDDMQKQCLLAQQYEVQHQGYDQQFSDCAPLVLTREDMPVGRLFLAQDIRGLHILDMLLAQNWRGRGIGTALIQGVQACAFTHQLPVFLSVDRLSAYAGFYRKLGFAICRSDDILWTMRWPPQGRSHDTGITSRHSTAEPHGFRPLTRYAKGGPAKSPPHLQPEYENDPEPEVPDRKALQARR